MVQKTLSAVNETGDKLQQRLDNARTESLQLERLCQVPVQNPFIEKQERLIIKLGKKKFMRYYINCVHPYQSSMAFQQVLDHFILIKKDASQKLFSTVQNKRMVNRC